MGLHKTHREKYSYTWAPRCERGAGMGWAKSLRVMLLPGCQTGQTQSLDQCSSLCCCPRRRFCPCPPRAQEHFILQSAPLSLSSHPQSKRWISTVQLPMMSSYLQNISVHLSVPFKNNFFLSSSHTSYLVNWLVIEGLVWKLYKFSMNIHKK